MSLELVKQQQYYQYDQYDSAKSHAGMAHAVAVAAETAAQAANQVNDHENDQDHPKRHGTLPQPTARFHRSRRSVASENPPFGGSRKAHFAWRFHAGAGFPI